MTKKLMRIAITGGAGNISYSLLFRIASGEMLSKDQPIALHILEIPQAESSLEGVVMELNDCAFEPLKEIVYGSDPKVVFKDVDIAILVGAKPRSKGMERNDLLKENAKIFVGQGKALNEVANKDVKVLVVGNPCNTNCWITMKCAPSLNPKNFHAMTRLDQNRAAYQIASKASVELSEVNRALIWGNHSSTQVPDIVNTRIGTDLITDVIKDEKWLKEDFFSSLQKRGAEIISARGKSSAASAANGAIDAIISFMNETESGDYYSDAVLSNGNPYGIKDDLIFSFPCTSKGDGEWDFVHGLKLDEFMKGKLKITEDELLEEKEIVSKIIQEEL